MKKIISFDDYKNCVLNDEPKNVEINAIRTVKMINYSLTHVSPLKNVFSVTVKMINYSLTQNKVALSNKDDKRVWKNTNSTAWGHWRNLGSAPNEQ